MPLQGLDSAERAMRGPPRTESRVTGRSTTSRAVVHVAGRRGRAKDGARSDGEAGVEPANGFQGLREARARERPAKSKPEEGAERAEELEGPEVGRGGEVELVHGPAERGMLCFEGKVTKKGEQFVINLPKAFNPTWRGLWKAKKRVKICIEI